MTNRKIAFRAWDGEEMYYRDKDGLKTFFAYAGSDAWKDCPLMQFTGFTDKNGKEIYEGDVVKDDDNGSKSPTVREVRFGEAAVDASDYEQYEVSIVGFYLTNYLGNAYGEEFEALSSGKSRHLEVIGNIYENPELLSV